MVERMSLKKTLQTSARKMMSVLLRYSSSEKFSDFLLWPVSKRLFCDYSETVEIRPGLRLTVYGDMADGVNKTLMFMSRYKALAWEPATARLVEMLAPRVSGVIDAGSHIGYYPLIVSHVNPEAEVYAFEPNPGTHERLVHNISLNNFSNITPIAGALGDTNTTQKMFFDFGQSSFVESNRPHAGEGTVHVVTLDSFCEADGKKIDLIILDAEGYEPHIIRGGMETIREQKPDIIFEINQRALVAAGSSHEILCQTLVAQGYSIFIIRDDYSHRLNVKSQEEVVLEPYRGNLPNGVSFLNAFATMNPEPIQSLVTIHEH